MGEGYIPKIPLGVAKGILGVDAGGAQLTITVQQYAGDMDVLYIASRSEPLTLGAQEFEDFWSVVSALVPAVKEDIDQARAVHLPGAGAGAVGGEFQGDIVALPYAYTGNKGNSVKGVLVPGRAVLLQRCPGGNHRRLNLRSRHRRVRDHPLCGQQHPGKERIPAVLIAVKGMVTRPLVYVAAGTKEMSLTLIVPAPLDRLNQMLSVVIGWPAATAVRP